MILGKLTEELKEDLQNMSIYWIYNFIGYVQRLNGRSRLINLNSKFDLNNKNPILGRNPVVMELTDKAIKHRQQKLVYT